MTTLHGDVKSYLNILFNCVSLNRNISNEKNAIKNHIMTLHTLSNYMEDEKINKDDYRIGLEQYMKEVQNAFVDIHIGGIETFTHHIIIVNGTLVVYNEAFSNTGLSETVKKLYDTSTKIISDVSSWQGALGFGCGFIGLNIGIKLNYLCYNNLYIPSLA